MTDLVIPLSGIDEAEDRLFMGVVVTFWMTDESVW